MDFDFPAIEQKILKFWNENKIFEKLRRKNQGNPSTTSGRGKHWSFLDGPITANNPMGVHHAWGRTYKDLFQRYKAMRGFDQRFQNGFDCQGLWVEVEVEKELGFKTKKDIEKYGIDKFVEKCKERVRKYSAVQTQQSIRLGQWMDWGDWKNGLGNSYYTMSDENNYAIWGFLKKCHEKGYLYKGRDSVPWCPRCGTAISQHEILTEEYKELTHEAIYFKLPSKDFKFLVWTTTPWTIPANSGLILNPDFDYGVFNNGKEKLLLLKELGEKILGKEYILEKTYKGTELKGVKYEGPFDYLPRVKEARAENEKIFHTVVLDKDLVTAIEGTGIIHCAPGAGEEDFKIGKKEGIPVIAVIDESAVYLPGMGEFTSQNAKENPEIIFDYLKNHNNGEFFFKTEQYTHRYPTCWRCKTELVWRVVDEWYISMKKLRKTLMDIAKKITWIPSFGLERELDWLKNMQDWMISKKRYWGLALPIFECQCGNFEVIGSKKELKEKAIEGWDSFNGHSPHRPWIDEIKIKCSGCGGLVSRIKDVGNPWLDAGIVPFSTMGYYTDRKYWKKWFPVELVCESFPGQFKNWFYVIIVMSAVLENTNPVKTIFGYASVHDEKGEEMHKSKGNAIWFDDAVEKIGADPMRWMYAKQNPVYNLNFGYKAAEEIKRKLLILYNAFIFLNTYVKKENFPKEEKISSPKNILDKWILSRFNSLILNVSENLDKYDPSNAVLAIESFFVDDLSLWYIRRSRKRFHLDGQDRDEAIKIFYYVLLNILKIIAPIIPFFSEEIYLTLKTEKMPESVHLSDWPHFNKKYIDKDLENKMAEVRRVVALALAARASLGIKVRQPLASLKIKNQKTNIKNEENLLELIKDEINVREIIFDAKIEREIELDANLTDDLKKEGDRREFIRNIKELRKIGGYTPQLLMNNIISTISIIDFGDEQILKEIGAKNFIKISDEKEIPQGYIKKEMKLKDGKSNWVAIPKIKK